MKMTLVVGMVLSLGMLGAVGGGCGNNGGGMVTVPLNAVNGSGESGTAVLTDQGNNMTQVVLTVSGGTDTGAQPAHIHIGTCGSNGNIFAPLTSVNNGASTTSVPYALNSLTGGKYYINVHKSTDINTIMACGNIP